MKKGFLISFMILAFTSGRAYPITELLLFGEEEVAIATRTRQKISAAPATVTVIGKDQIRRSGARSLADILRTEPGIYIVPSERHLKKIFVRNVGAESSYNDKVLLQIDGIPQRELTYGHAFIDEYFPVENIKRIEMIRGPGSALYGTNAFAGVINVITEDFIEEPGVILSMGWGGDRTQNYTSAFKSETAGGELTFFARQYRTDGDGPSYSQRYERNAVATDPIESIFASVGYSYQKLKLNAKYIEYHHKFTTNWDMPYELWERNWFTYKNLFLDAAYEHSLTDASSLSFKGWWQYYDNHAFYQLPDSSISTFTAIASDIWTFKESQMLGAEIQFMHEVPDRNNLILGGEYNYDEIIEVVDLPYGRKEEKYEDPPPFKIPSMSRNKTALYAQNIFNATDWMALTVGVRNDFNEDFGSFLCPRGGLVLTPEDKISFRLLYGHSFRAPSYREMFTETSEWTEGNKDLKPEEIAMPEIGADYSVSDNIKVGLNMYRGEITNLIRRIELDDGSWRHANSESVTDITGLEAQIKFNYPQVDGFFNLTWADIRDRELRRQLHSLPSHMANMGLNLRPDWNFNLNTTVSYVGPRARWEDDTNIHDPAYPAGERRPDINGYATVDITLMAKLDAYTDITFSVYNLFDQDQYDPHETPKRYDIERPGRSFFVRANYRF